MILGEFGTKLNLEFLQIGRVDHALTEHLGVESRGEIIDTPFVDSPKHVGTIEIHPGFLQYTQPWKKYQNVNLG